MIYKRICEQCLAPFSTENPDMYTDNWDCQRLEFVKKYPRIALKVRELDDLAFDDGLMITASPEQGITVSNRFDPDDNEEWRRDVAKLRDDARKSRKRLKPIEAWDKVANKTVAKITAKYPSNRKQILAAKGDGLAYEVVDGQLVERLNYNV